MKKSKFTTPQIMGMIKEYEGGKSAEQVATDHKVPLPTFHSWRRKFGTGVSIKGNKQKPDGKRIKELEEEVAMLKRMYGELSLQHGILKDSFK